MEISNQEEMKAHLMGTSEQYRSLAEKHAQFHKRLEEIEAKAHLTLEDEDEEHRIKKQKLRLKDEMNAMLSQLKAQPV